MTDAAVETSVDLTPDGFDFDLEESIYTAELDSVRLLEDIEENRLNSKAKVVYSNILYEFYTQEARGQEALSERHSSDDDDVERNADLYIFNHEAAQRFFPLN